ncbi:hypothetical protein T4B_7617 [Trichinella pseudospiralis]|uniref:Transmembrane protein n=1 Tax=Trichinella pseudospiralis TaxID=6337 RepID=A0A0V1HNT1_TRIPS|nr:hypothetical protein T4B_7617 [Trichinella pseudospiralis]
MRTLAFGVNKIYVFYTKLSLSISTTRDLFLLHSDINDEIYTSVAITATFLCSIFIIIWLLLETAVFKFEKFPSKDFEDYLESLPPEEEIFQLPPCEDGNLTDEEHIEEDDLDKVMPLDVCGGIDVIVDSDRIGNEDDLDESSDNQTWSKRKSLNHGFGSIPV